jgi:hypothetical protein
MAKNIITSVGYARARDFEVGDFFIQFAAGGNPDRMAKVNSITKVGNDVTINGNLTVTGVTLLGVPLIDGIVKEISE